MDWGNTSLTKSSYKDDGKYLGVSAAGIDGKIDKYEYDGKKIVVSAIGAKCGKVFFPKDKFTAIKNTIVLHKPKKDVSEKFLFYVLDNNIDFFPKRGGGQPFISKGDIEKTSIHLPKLETQNKIVGELDSYQKIIDGCNQVIENYKPSIDIDPKWKLRTLRDLIKLSSGNGLTQNKFKKGNYDVFGGNGIVGKHNEYFLEQPTIVIGRVGAYCGSIHITSPKSWVTDNSLYVKEFLEDIDLNFLYLTLISLRLNQYSKVGGQPSLSQQDILKLNIQLPPIDKQREIADELSNLQKLIDDNRKILSIYKNKVEKKINSIWSK